MQGYINDSTKGIFTLIFVGHASLERFRNGMPAAKPLGKNSPRYQLDPFSSHIYRSMSGWGQCQLHNLFFKLIGLQNLGLKTCTTVTILPQLQSIRRVNSSALKLVFFPQLCGDQIIKRFFSALPLIVIPRNIPQKVMHSSEIFLAENLTAIHRTNPGPSFSKFNSSLQWSATVWKNEKNPTFYLTSPCLA